jgi:hypothetical protein
VRRASGADGSARSRIALQAGWKPRPPGCLAVGNNAAEDLFVLAADADWEHAVVLISPVDFRRAALPPSNDCTTPAPIAHSPVAVQIADE